MFGQLVSMAEGSSYGTAGALWSPLLGLYRLPGLSTTASKHHTDRCVSGAKIISSFQVETLSLDNTEYGLGISRSRTQVSVDPLSMLNPFCSQSMHFSLMLDALSF